MFTNLFLCLNGNLKKFFRFLKPQNIRFLHFVSSRVSPGVPVPSQYTSKPSLQLVIGGDLTSGKQGCSTETSQT
jgi:hypothetical protein